MNYTQAKEKHKKQWMTGKHKKTQTEYVFPYNNLYKDDNFIVIRAFTSNCLLQETETLRVNKYVRRIDRGEELGPSWGMYGKKLQNGEVVPFWHNKLYIVDGNHRLSARIKLGYKLVEVIIPQSNYELYVRNNNE